MAHYAFLDKNNIVTEVIVGKNEDEEGINWEQHYGNFRGQLCKRTSYNTVGGVHKFGGTSFRKNYAGIGYTYDLQRDAFIPPKPYNSWVLNEITCLWESPIAYPNDGKIYIWNEETNSWRLPIPYPITYTQDELGNSTQDLYTWNQETQSWDLVTK